MMASVVADGVGTGDMGPFRDENRGQSDLLWSPRPLAWDGSRIPAAPLPRRLLGDAHLAAVRPGWSAMHSKMQVFPAQVGMQLSQNAPSRPP